ncbi:MAG: mechanosensitive ion channel [Anaerolineae bacterium]|jgi:miniconductance mechanosensitive channel
MTIEAVQIWIQQNPTLAPWVVLAALIVSCVVSYLIARNLIARGLVALSRRTESRYDDIFVDNLRPFRFAWIAPLLIIYIFAGFLPENLALVQQLALFLLLWFSILSLGSLLNAVNAIYEASYFYHGEPIQGWLDLGKVLLIVVGIILSISMFTGQSPIVLLGGLGAIMAILLLIFRDTILSFVASLQIQANDLILEGDTLEVPSYEADGSVVNISLYSVKVRNWDKSITMIPTYKLVQVPYKNWRDMIEGGARRIKRSIHIDQHSVQFCTPDMIDCFFKIELVREYLETELSEFQWDGEGPLDRDRLTNMDIYRQYVIRYLRSRPDLHQEDQTLLVRQLAPGPSGLPLEIYAFTCTTDWTTYEEIQADILNHLLAALPNFGLRLFQQPAGADLHALKPQGN